jgi:glutathione S-transferase
LRPWILLKPLGKPFTERFFPFGAGSSYEAFRKFSPTGRVPELLDGDVKVWDSLAIAEYLAERHAGVWPEDGVVRAWARSAAAEMHSGFSTLRDICTMNCGIRVMLKDMPPELAPEMTRIGELWAEGLGKFGGPFLTGKKFSAADAFFAPVAFGCRPMGLK